MELLKRKGSSPDCVPEMIDLLLLKPNDYQTYPPGLILPLFDFFYRSKIRHLLWENQSFCQFFPKFSQKREKNDEILANGMKKNVILGKSEEILANLILGKRATSDETLADGMSHLISDRFLKLRFPNDLRIVEVRRILTNNQPIHVPISQTPGISDAEFRDQQEKFLQSAALRQMALSFGRGALTLGTVKPMISDPLQIPKISFTGKTAPKNQTIELPHNDAQPLMEWWPQFHNGVATGLSVVDAGFYKKPLDSAWVGLNFPRRNENDQFSAEEAGLLMGLGLRGYLKQYGQYNIHELLAKADSTTTVAVLLGIASNFIGTADVQIMKMLSVHLPFLLPVTQIEYTIDPHSQIVALIGVGMIYAETENLWLTETFLRELGKPAAAGTDLQDRQAFALACGLAIGWINLGKGKNLL